MLRRLAPYVGDSGRLVGLDMSPGMIALAQSLAESSGVQAEFHVGLADCLPFPNQSFDWVHCQQGSQFFPDKPTALSEIRRVLKHGGRSVISVRQSLERHAYFQAIDNASFQHAGIHMYVAPHSMGDQDLLRQLLVEAGFREIRIEPVSVTIRAEDPMKIVRLKLTGATAAIPSLQPLSQQEKSDLVEGVMELARGAIDEHTVDGMLTIPWHAYLAIAVK